ncbi:MAG TPA: 30S ribosomal protein S6 [Chitinophagaceae bacterium]|nr:30S ribosomal protein S6 [Chitinophagaceae bacterium]
MNSYELMVIFTPVLSTEEFNAATKNLKKFVTDQGGEVVGDDSWGLKSLAYPIAKKTTGLYYVMEFKAATAFNSRFTIQMNRDESIMRFMITALDKHAVAYNDRKRNGVKVTKPNSVTEKEEA